MKFGSSVCGIHNVVLGPGLNYGDGLSQLILLSPLLYICFFFLIHEYSDTYLCIYLVLVLSWFRRVSAFLHFSITKETSERADKRNPSL